MYDINTKNVKKGKNFYYIFLASGLFFLIIIGCIVISDYIKFYSLDSTKTSTRVKIDSHRNDEGTILYSPTYYYEVNGKQYSCSSSSSSSRNPGTSNKTVYYDSKDPSNCMTEYTKSSDNFFLIMLFIPVVFIILAVVNINKINKRVRLINELNSKGKLIKNLPYSLEDTGMLVNGVQVQKPVVNYTLPSGSTITLQGDPRHDKKIADADGMVDLVIDENNPSNYFIDFEINRISGNLPTDYYTDSQQNIPNTNAQNLNQPQQVFQNYTNTLNQNSADKNINNNIQ